MTPCGCGTPYLRLLDVEGKILFLGASFRTMTFYHGVEEVIEALLPFSPFTSEAYEMPVRDVTGRLWTAKNRLYDPDVSRRRDITIMIPALKQRDLWREDKVGRLRAILVPARGVLNVVRKLAETGMFCYRVVQA